MIFSLYHHHPILFHQNQHTQYPMFENHLEHLLLLIRMLHAVALLLYQFFSVHYILKLELYSQMKLLHFFFQQKKLFKILVKKNLLKTKVPGSSVVSSSAASVTESQEFPEIKIKKNIRKILIFLYENIAIFFFFIQLTWIWNSSTILKSLYRSLNLFFSFCPQFKNNFHITQSVKWKFNFTSGTIFFFLV